MAVATQTLIRIIPRNQALSKYSPVNQGYLQRRVSGIPTLGQLQHPPICFPWSTCPCSLTKKHHYYYCLQSKPCQVFTSSPWEFQNTEFDSKVVLLSSSLPHFVTRTQSSSASPRVVIWDPCASNHKCSNPVKGLGRGKTLYYSYQLFSSPHQFKLSSPPSINQNPLCIIMLK